MSSIILQQTIINPKMEASDKPAEPTKLLVSEHSQPTVDWEVKILSYFDKYLSHPRFS